MSKFKISSVLCFLAASLNAQVEGRVTGTVVDPAAAVVPNATVSLQLPGATTSLFNGRTTAAGDFTLSSVTPGAYELVVEAAGFAKAVVTGVQVNASRATDIPPI